MGWLQGRACSRKQSGLRRRATQVKEEIQVVVVIVLVFLVMVAVAVVVVMVVSVVCIARSRGMGSIKGCTRKGLGDGVGGSGGAKVSVVHEGHVGTKVIGVVRTARVRGKGRQRKSKGIRAAQAVVHLRMVRRHKGGRHQRGERGRGVG